MNDDRLDTSSLVTVSDIMKSVEFSYDGIWITDGLGNTLFVNDAIQRITRLHKQDVVGRNMQELVERRVFDISATLLAIQRKTVVTVMQHVETGIDTIVTATPVLGAQGEVDKVISNVRDITELNKLKARVESIEVEKRAYENEIITLKAQLNRVGLLITCCDEMKKTVKKALKISGFDTSVLISGESGVGKDLLATLIHENSERKAKPFVTLHCGGLPSELLESELFGYEEGAFAGAVKGGKIGLFEAADGGTLFLDEIDELPLSVQSKIISVLQKGEYTKLGGVRPKSANFRVLSATKADLSLRVEDGSFRNDLYYRVNVFKIMVPALRDRREDIPVLIQHFLDELGKRYKQKKRFSLEVISDFTQREWPGNVRELKNSVERLYVTADSELITMACVHDMVGDVSMEAGRANTKNHISLKAMVEELEKSVLERAYQQLGTTYEVAKALGISQTSVVRKAKKYAIEMKHSGRPRRT